MRRWPTRLDGKQSRAPISSENNSSSPSALGFRKKRFRSRSITKFWRQRRSHRLIHPRRSEVSTKAISKALVTARTNSSARCRRRTSTECCNSTGSDDNGLVVNRADIQIELVKLPGGERLLRLAEPVSGLALERKL